MGAADAHDAGFKAKVEEAGAHDAGWPGGSRPKWGQLMLMMRARQGVQGQSGGS